MPEIVNLQHHPWGNSYFPTARCGGNATYDVAMRRCWAQQCVGSSSPAADCFSPLSAAVAQFGQEEYQVNRYQACAKLLTAADSCWATRYWPFAVCMERETWKANPLSASAAATQCASSHGIDGTQLESCFAVGSTTGDAAVVA